VVSGYRHIVRSISGQYLAFKQFSQEIHSSLSLTRSCVQWSSRKLKADIQSIFLPSIHPPLLFLLWNLPVMVLTGPNMTVANELIVLLHQYMKLMRQTMHLPL